ncbi:hypothetical protein EJB05_56226, partial [Eragrostis curvula]
EIYRSSEDKGKEIYRASRQECGCDWCRGEPSHRRQLRDRSCSSLTLGFSEPRGERRASHLQWRSKENSADNGCYPAQTMQFSSSHNHVTGIHDGLEQYQHHTIVGTRSDSDAILIVPQEHSPTTQQLEAWLGSLARARKTTQSHSDDITIAFTVDCSPKVTQPRPKVMSRESTNVPAEKSPEVAPMKRKTNITNTESETDNSFTTMLKQFEKAVTKPLEPWLFQTPTTNPIAKEGQMNEQWCSPRLRTKRKKLKLVVKMAHAVLAKKRGSLGNKEALKALALIQYLQTYRKLLPPSTLQAIKKFAKVSKKKKQKKNLPPRASNMIRRGKGSGKCNCSSKVPASLSK